MSYGLMRIGALLMKSAFGRGTLIIALLLATVSGLDALQNAISAEPETLTAGADTARLPAPALSN